MPLNPYVQTFLQQAQGQDVAPQNSLVDAKNTVAARAAAKWQAQQQAAYHVTPGSLTYLPGTTVGGGAPGGAAPGGSGLFGAVGLGGGDVVNRIMQTIRGRESGGNYNAQNPHGSAHGAYQFVRGTWAGLNRQFGGNVNDWSPAHQDDIARRYIQQILNNNHGNIQSVAPTWYVGHYDPSNMNYIPHGGNTMTVADYLAAWMRDYARTG